MIAIPLLKTYETTYLRSEPNDKNSFRSYHDDCWLPITFHVTFQRTILSASLRANHFIGCRTNTSCLKTKKC